MNRICSKYIYVIIYLDNLREKWKIDYSIIIILDYGAELYVNPGIIIVFEH